MTSVSVSVRKRWPSSVQLLLEGQVVLDDAVVHHHHVALAVAVRVGVLLGGTPVGGPARVADAVAALHGIDADGFFQVAQLARGAAQTRRSLLVVEHGDARPNRSRGIPAAAGRPG